VIASDHFYDLHKGRRDDVGDSPLERGETFTSFYTLGSPIALWMERYGDFSRPVRIPGKTSDDPVIVAAAEWINFYDADDVLAFPLKGLSADYDDRQQPGLVVERSKKVPRLMRFAGISQLATLSVQ